MKMEVRIPKSEDIRVGDVILEFTINGTVNVRRPPRDWVVTSVDKGIVAGLGKDGSSKSLFFDDTTNWLVEREVAGTTGVSVPSKRTLEDWPITCPRCGRAKSAVVLFSSTDCKHGCYARPAAKAGAQ